MRHIHMSALICLYKLHNRRALQHNSMSLTPPTGQPEAPVQESEALCSKEGCGGQLVRHAQLAHTGQLQVYTAQQGFPENQTCEGSEPKKPKVS